MSDRRRYIIIAISVSAGTMLSFLMFKAKKGTLTDYDYLTLISVMVVSLILIVGISIILSKWKN